MKTKLLLSQLGLMLLCCVTANADPLTIGYVTDLSASGAWFGVQTQRGAKLAERELQSKGAAIKLLIEDAGDRPASALSAATKLLSISKVDVLICDLTPTCTAISAKAAAEHVPLIYHSPSRLIARDNPLAFRNFLDYVEGCRAIAQIWKKQAITKVAALIPNLEFGELCAQGGQAEFPQIVIERYNPGDDLRSLIPAFRAKSFEAILMVGYENDHLRWFSLGREQKLPGKYGFIDIYLTPQFIAAGGELLENATVFGYYPIDQEFIERLNAAFPRAEKVNLQGAALAYNAVYAIEQADRHCLNHEKSCLSEQIKSSIAQKLMDFRGLGNSPAYPMRLSKFVNGALVSQTEK